MEYPNLESAIMDTTGVEEAELVRYRISETIMGIEADSEETLRIKSSEGATG